MAKRFSRGETEMVATMKFIARCCFFPLTWLGWAWIAGLQFGGSAAVVAFCAAAVCGYAAVRVLERLDTFAGRLRAVLHRRRSGALREEREAIRREFIAVAEEIGVQ